MKTKIDDFEKVIKEILEGYAENIDDAVNEAVKKVAQAAVQELKATSPRSSGSPTRGKPKHYADMWAARVNNKKERIGLTINGIIYVKPPEYRLTHLLEYGHINKRTGRMVKAFPHVKPVEEKIYDEFRKYAQLQDVTTKIQNRG